MSIGNLDADVAINLEFNDNATAKVDASTKSINKNWRDMRDQQRAVGRQFELNHRTFTQTARSIEAVGHIANRVVNAYQALQLANIRLNDAQREQRDLQRQINEAIREGDLEKAADLTLDQKKAADEASRAVFDLAFAYVFMGTAIASAAASISRKLLPALAKISGKTGPIPSTTPTAGGANIPKGTGAKGKFSLGGAGKVGLGAAGLIAGGLAENVLSSDDPIQAILDFFQSRDVSPKIKIIVNVNGTEQIIDLNNPYVES